MRQLNFKYFFITFFMVLMSTLLPLSAQNDLKTSKSKLLKEIKVLNKQIESLNSDKKGTEQRIALVTQKITFREDLIKVYRKEIKVLSGQITTLNDSITAIHNHISHIKQNFSELLRSFQVQQSTSNNWLFILNADNLQQAYKRYHYLKQYSDYRKTQVADLLQKSELLKSKKSELDKRKSQKVKLESENKQQSSSLIKDKEDLNTSLGKINLKKQDLLAKIRAKKKKAAAIEKQIREALRRERALAKKRAEEAAKKKNKSGNSSPKSGSTKKEIVFGDTPQGKLVSKQFSGNKGKLSWPVKQGEIHHKFGPYHPKGLPNITFDVKGLEISTPLNEKVQAIFEGKVSAIFIIPNGTKGIVLRHGSYVTIYANLKEVYVKEGDFVKVNKVLGKVASEDATFGLLDFQIWIEYQNSEKNLNPQLWLRKR